MSSRIGLEYPCSALVDKLEQSLRPASTAVQLAFLEVHAAGAGLLWRARALTPAPGRRLRRRHEQGLRSAWLKAYLLERMLSKVVDPASLPLAAVRSRTAAPTAPLSVERIVTLYWTALPQPVASPTDRPAEDGADAAPPPLDWFVYLAASLMLAYIAYMGPHVGAADRQLLQGLPDLVAALEQRVSAAVAATPSPASPPCRAASAGVPAWSDTLQLLQTAVWSPADADWHR